MRTRGERPTTKKSQIIFQEYRGISAMRRFNTKKGRNSMSSYSTCSDKNRLRHQYRGFNSSASAHRLIPSLPVLLCRCRVMRSAAHTSEPPSPTHLGCLLL